MINHVFISFSIVQIYDLSYIYLHSSSSMGILGTPAPSWLDSSVGRALHRYCRGHGFESCSGLYFFQALTHNCLNCVCDCDDKSCCGITFLCVSSRLVSLTKGWEAPTKQPYNEQVT